MKLLMIGRAQDGLDHSAWCREAGHEVYYVDPNEIPPNAVAQADDILSFADGLQVLTEVLRKQRGLPGRGMEAVALLTDKVLFKSHPAVRPHIVRYLELDPALSKEVVVGLVAKCMPFPVVIKPSNGFYSAGVVRADDADQLKRAYLQARRVCMSLPGRASPPRLIVEQYLAGSEFAVDGFVVGDCVHPLIIHRKRPGLIGPTFHELAYLTECFDAAKGVQALKMLEEIVSGVGLRDSAFHAEFRFDAEGRLYVLEVAPRLAGGGATTQQLMALCTGIDAYACMHALGRGAVDLTPTRQRCALEYDFGPDATGMLLNVQQTAVACMQRGAAHVIRYHADGDIVLGPPNNIECILTAFFECDSLIAGQALFDDIYAHCSIRTKKI